MGVRPTQGNEKRLGPASTLYEPLPFPCHPDRSEAERRDLRFRGPFLDMCFDRSVPRFPATQNSQHPRMRLSVKKGA
jgi:hypothetical protein